MAFFICSKKRNIMRNSSRSNLIRLPLMTTFILSLEIGSAVIVDPLSLMPLGVISTHESSSPTAIETLFFLNILYSAQA
ncbi:MAG: hypothetical protein J6T68_00845 [Candidatus Methanomethylophilaceae archaeon]|nr:hypothetical protein [Candidatus Methanomethylophilaceae archaeon]